MRDEGREWSLNLSNTGNNKLPDLGSTLGSFVSKSADKNLYTFSSILYSGICFGIPIFSHDFDTNQIIFAGVSVFGPVKLRDFNKILILDQANFFIYFETAKHYLNAKNETAHIICGSIADTKKFSKIKIVKLCVKDPNF